MVELHQGGFATNRATKEGNMFHITNYIYLILVWKINKCLSLKSDLVAKISFFFSFSTIHPLQENLANSNTPTLYKCTDRAFKFRVNTCPCEALCQNCSAVRLYRATLQRWLGEMWIFHSRRLVCASYCCTVFRFQCLVFRVKCPSKRNHSVCIRGCA